MYSTKTTNKSLRKFTVAVLIVSSYVIAPIQVQATSGQTVRVGLGNNNSQYTGTQARAGSVSADGTKVIFSAEVGINQFGSTVFGAFVRDLSNGSTTRLDVNANGQTSNSTQNVAESISSDGRHVVYTSAGTNLDPADTDGNPDIYLYDTQLLTRTLISKNASNIKSNGPNIAPTLSTDGRYVTFASTATNYVSGVTNSFQNIYTKDLISGSVTRVSLSTGGAEPDNDSFTPSNSNDGRYVTFGSRATNLVINDTNGVQDVFLRDTQLGTTVKISNGSLGENPQSNIMSGRAMSGDGRYIVFASEASNVVPGDLNSKQDVFMFDRDTTIITMLSGSGENQANNHNSNATITNDGSAVAFTSTATNLVPGHTGLYSDVLRWRKATNTLDVISTGSAGEPANDHSGLAGLSSDGHHVIFNSGASNFAQGDTNNSFDVFIKSLQIDFTAPIVVGTPEREPNSNGWYDDDVNISWNSIDPAPSSGGITQPSPTTAGTEGIHTYTSTPSCDSEQNCANGTIELKIDKTVPTISYTVYETPNPAGWNHSDTTVSFNCSDSISGIGTCSQPVVVSSETASQTIFGTATDLAGNTTTIPVTVKLDKTLPAISATINPAPNQYGWNSSNISVSFDCTDSLSGVALCSMPVLVDTETEGRIITGTASDVAGNERTSNIVVKLDKTAPLVSQASLNNNSLSANAADSLSGVIAGEYYVDSDPGSGNGIVMNISGNTLMASLTAQTNGTHTIGVRSRDQAGNYSAVTTLRFITVLGVNRMY